MGKHIISTMAIKSQIRKGAAARQISAIVVSVGTMPFITNKSIPNGGVVSPISKVRRNIIPNHTGSIPTAITIGINMGIVIIIIETCSINMPRKIRTNCIAIRRAILDMARLVTNSTSPKVAPLKASSWLKVFDAKIIMNTITVIRMVPSAHFFKMAESIFLYAAARMSAPRAPVAEASVGVAIPKKITPTTRKMIPVKGKRYITEDTILSERGT